MANLLDGMVAIGRGVASPVGELFNEVPDRVSDTAVLVGLGVAAGSVWLGLAAALAAMATAYVRTTARAAGAPSDFGGPMAKQHRMALVTALALWCAVIPADPGGRCLDAVGGAGGDHPRRAADRVAAAGRAPPCALRATAMIRHGAFAHPVTVGIVRGGGGGAAGRGRGDRRDDATGRGTPELRRELVAAHRVVVPAAAADDRAGAARARMGDRRR